MRGGALRAVEVVAEALERIERADPVLCAFLEVWGGEALRRADEVDARVAAGERLPLAGVPIAVKGRHGLCCARLRPWSAAYAANTSVAVPPV
ncbi:amidase family protein, partial [Streptomyces sp. NPDC004976]